MPAMAPSESELSGAGGMIGTSVGVKVAEAVSLGDVRVVVSSVGYARAVVVTLLDDVVDTNRGSSELVERIVATGIVSAVIWEDLALYELRTKVELTAADGNCGYMPTTLQAPITFCVASFCSCLLQAASTHDSVFRKMSPLEQWQRRSTSCAQPSTTSSFR